MDVVVSDPPQSASGFNRHIWGTAEPDEGSNTRCLLVLGGRMAIIRQTALRIAFNIESKLPPEDAYLITVQLKPLAHFEQWYGTKSIYSRSLPLHATSILDLNMDPHVCVRSSFDGLHFYFPKAELRAMLEEQGFDGTFELSAPDIPADPVLGSIAGLMAPCLDGQHTIDPKFFDHLTLAVVWHVLSTYTKKPGSMARSKAALSIAAIAKAKVLLGNFESPPTLEAVATECGMSPVQFTRAFKKSTGVTPAKWSQRARTEAAKALLQTPGLNLQDIAAACGFADQSHFIRNFTAATGFAPNAWRRAMLG